METKNGEEKLKWRTKNGGNCFQLEKLIKMEIEKL